MGDLQELKNKCNELSARISAFENRISHMQEQIHKRDKNDPLDRLRLKLAIEKTQEKLLELKVIIAEDESEQKEKNKRAKLITVRDILAAVILGALIAMGRLEVISEYLKAPRR